ncbi:MAG: DNA helicase PriA [Bacilli bacterium]|nr:DNA helicase PriA [Bacilli bacterium]
MSVADYKCPNCSSTLKFNPKTQKWNCEYCNSQFGLNDLNSNDLKYQNVEQNKKIDIYSCSNCGAEIITDSNTSATFCVYCKSTAIIKNRLVNELEPNKIIPFATTREEAINAFKKMCSKRILVPKAFKDQKNIEEIKGVYIPFWLFDVNCSGSLLYKAQKEDSREDQNYKVITTKYYKVEREGTIYFNNIPVDGSVNFDDAAMNSIEPFDYTGLKDFNYGYLSGFYAEKYGLTDADVGHIAMERAKSSFIDYLDNDINGYTSKTLKEENIDNRIINVQYVLLPVWLLNIKYKEEFRTFAMNGQTGKMAGNLPIDKLKMFILAVIIFILLFVAVVLGFYSVGWCL